MSVVLENIKTRRSIRSFKQIPVEREKLELILEAASFAPCSGGRQAPIMVVCQDKEIIDQLDTLNGEAFRAIMSQRPMDEPGGKQVQLPAPDMSKPVKVFSDAPVLVTIFTPKNWYNFDLDAACAAENMLLAAHDLGVGSRFIARAKETFASPYGQELQAKWGLSPEYEAKVFVVLGYADGPIPEAKPRKEGHILFVD